MNRSKPALEAIVPLEDQAVILVGPPSCVRGLVTLRNTSEQRLTIRRCRVNSIDEILAPEAGLQATLGSTRVPGGATTTTEIVLELPSSTAPGEYRASLEISGVPFEARIVITEVMDLEISPARLIVENDPSRKITRRVVVRNIGNMSLIIGEIGAVVLDDELMDCRTLRGALAELTGSEVSIGRVIGALASNAHAALEQAGALRVHNATGRQTIAPGETELLNLEIRVPEHLDRHTRYFGDARIYTQNLSFLVVPAGGVPSPPGPEASGELP
jgi:hypothetical protein